MYLRQQFDRFAFVPCVVQERRVRTSPRRDLAHCGSSRCASLLLAGAGRPLGVWSRPPWQPPGPRARTGTAVTGDARAGATAMLRATRMRVTVAAAAAAVTPTSRDVWGTGGAPEHAQTATGSRWTLGAAETDREGGCTARGQGWPPAARVHPVCARRTPGSGTLALKCG